MSQYELRSGSAVKKDIKGLRDKLKEEIKTIHLPRIQQNPLYGDPLGEPFRAKGIRSYHLTFERKDYRIAYRIFEKEKVVALVMIGPREGFYARLKRRV